MSIQIFKKNIPFNILNDFLKSSTDDYHTFNKDSYKKSCINGSINVFINSLQEYYHHSKQYYLTRKMSYKNLVTILRHVCNNLKITYTSKILYEKSNYEIVYYINIKKEDELTNVVADDQFTHNGIAF
jgi:hypothetical protein